MKRIVYLEDLQLEKLQDIVDNYYPGPYDESDITMGDVGEIMKALDEGWTNPCP